MIFCSYYVSLFWLNICFITHFVSITYDFFFKNFSFFFFLNSVATCCYSVFHFSISSSLPIIHGFSIFLSVVPQVSNAASLTIFDILSYPTPSVCLSSISYVSEGSVHSNPPDVDVDPEILELAD